MYEHAFEQLVARLLGGHCSCAKTTGRLVEAAICDVDTPQPRREALSP
jgi:hypothetical protein